MTQGQVPWWLTALIGLLGAIVGAVINQIWTSRREQQKDENRKGSLLSRVRFLLRELEVQFSVARDFPDKGDYDDELVTRLADIVFSEDVPLSQEARESVYAAASEARASIKYLRTERPRFDKNEAEYKEYMQAAARRALFKTYAAREAVDDMASVKWPSDPRNLHNWVPGREIPRK